jgi:hypothetical protein
MADSRPPTARRSWIVEHKRSLIALLIVVAILVLLPLLGMPLLGGLGGGVVSQPQ